MKDHIENKFKTTMRGSALTAGLGLLLMTILAPLAYFNGYQNLLVENDAVKTAENIIASETLFRLSICCFLFVALLDIIVAWALYVFLEPANKNLSLLSGWLRVSYAVVMLISVSHLLNILTLISKIEYLKVFELNHLNAQIMLSMSAFQYSWDASFVFFSFHLLILGFLVFKSNYAPKILGVLVIIECNS
ncbi:MAG: DUF4386 domain-containing protein [Spirochaetia bacterium]|nr:DUF4386 domain-containing protein [Spirochaetia bacterium]